MSLEGGDPDNRAVDHGHYRLDTPVPDGFGPKATVRPLRTESAPTGTSAAHTKGPGHSCGRVTGPLPWYGVLAGYRLCWESATVTSTRWNSFSSL